MDNELVDPIYCHKCKKRTNNISAERVQAVNGRWRVAAKCSRCKTNKSKFIAAPVIEDVVEPKIKNMSDDEKLSLAKELHKPVRKKFQKRKIMTKGIDDLWAADLLIMKQYDNENNGFGYILNVIDTFSKFAWALPLIKKDGKNVVKAFEKIIEMAKTQNHKAPNLLHTDKGLEFVNKLFKDLIKNKGIKMYHTQNEEKSAIIERFNRTLNEKIKIYFEVQNNRRWIDILQDLIHEYNYEDFHRTIGMRPFEVNKSNEEKVLIKLFGNQKTSQKVKFSLGDRVRITRFKKTFGNKYDAKWTKEIFTISGILPTNPITYKIKDLDEEIEGSFYAQELQKTECDLE